MKIFLRVILWIGLIQSILLFLACGITGKLQYIPHSIIAIISAAGFLLADNDIAKKKEGI